MPHLFRTLCLSVRVAGSIFCALEVFATMQDSELLYEVEVAGPPLCITMNGQDGGMGFQVVGVVHKAWPTPS